MILYYKFRAFLVTWLLRLMPRESPIVFKGPKSAITLCEQVALLGFKKVLIVTDSFLASSPVVGNVKQALEDNAVEVVVYDGVLPDPTFDKVQEGEKMLAENSCEAVIAIGGGSVLDAGKMVSLLHTNPGTLDDFDGIGQSKNLPVPLFAIPTTAGTGSEITLVAVISDPDTHKKVAIADKKLIPSFIALDAEIIQGLPPGLTAATGMDALTHAVESLLATSSVPATELLAKTSVRLIFQHLLNAYHNGDDLKSRDAMVLASFYAGSAFTRTSVGYVHGIAHQLGRICGTPHGNANAMVLPEVLRAYGPVINDCLADLAIEVGLGSSADTKAALALAFIERIEVMRNEMKMPLKPKDMGPHQVEEIVNDAITETGELYPVPRYMARDEISAIVKALL
jgi:alcohol dehydrogenase class IV